MLIGISRILNINELGVAFETAKTNQRFHSGDLDLLRHVTYATASILDISSILPDEFTDPYPAGFRILGPGVRAPKEPPLQEFFGDDQVNGSFDISEKSGCSLHLSSKTKSYGPIPAVTVAIGSNVIDPIELFALVDEKLSIRPILSVTRVNDNYQYLAQQAVGDRCLCIPGAEAYEALTYGRMPLLEGCFSNPSFTFGGLTPAGAVSIWDKLRPLLKGSVEYSYNIQGTSAIISELGEILPGPYINLAHGICPLRDLAYLDKIGDPFACVPLGAFDLKCCRNEVWMDAIKVPRGWQLYFPASELPAGIPKKKRPEILTEVCEILRMPNLFPSDMALPLDGKTF